MIKYGVKHISRGYLLNTEKDWPQYAENLFTNGVKNDIWKGTLRQAEIRLCKLGKQLHDLVCFVE